jgi:hypothetical protein
MPSSRPALPTTVFRGVLHLAQRRPAVETLGVPQLDDGAGEPVEDPGDDFLACVDVVGLDHVE